jgi:hypothetical protein
MQLSAACRGQESLQGILSVASSCRDATSMPQEFNLIMGFSLSWALAPQII